MGPSCKITVLPFLLVGLLMAVVLYPTQGAAANCYRMTYAFTPTTGTDNGLWIPVPKVWDRQGLVDAELVSITPDTGMRKTEQCGNQPVMWPLTDMNKELTVVFDVELAPVTLPVTPGTNWGTYQTTSTEYTFNTRATSMINSDDAGVQSQANAICGGLTDPYAMAQAIYNWVKSNLSYADGVEQDAITALSTRHGDCASFSNLFVAMCRAKGIPARGISGLLAMDAYYNEAATFTTGTWNAQQSGRRFSTHVWAEFLLPNGVWVQLDPTLQFFGAIPCERVILSKGNEIMLTWMVRPWFHLPMARFQVNDATVKLTIQYLGTLGIEHPAPATVNVAPIQLLLLN